MIEILTIKNKVPLYKGEEEANSIELLQFEEVGFEVVRQKGLNEVGEQVLFVYPDYCIPNIPLFKPFTEPLGDPKKSKLGSNNRIRAVKFNLHRGDNEPVYSNGIIFSKKELEDNGYNINFVTAEDLEITKYQVSEETEREGGVVTKGGKPFPRGMYKTDEVNILKNTYLVFPNDYIGTIKVDGSSITLWYKNGEYGICSRELSRPLFKTVVKGKRKPTIFERIKKFFGLKVELNIYETVENDDIFVKVGKPYLDVLVKYCEETNQNLVLRGELCGTASKGSGNKNNPHSNLEPQILFFGLDDYTTGVTIPKDFGSLLSVMLHLDNMSKVNFTTVGLMFSEEFKSKQELIDACNSIFKEKMIEGIVVQNSLGQSRKVMNLEYDAKK